jgi:AMOP domain
MEKRLLFLLLCLIACIYCVNTKTKKGVIAQQWLEQLPDCPCQNPDWNGVKTGDGWAKDQGDITTYHRGADVCYRSYPGVNTAEGYSGQQCCYDKLGNLITTGRAAGTPDKETTCSGENKDGVMTVRLLGIMGHLRKDVSPWKEMGGVDSGWIKYNLHWVPNNSNKCPDNTGLK